jgi:CBS domain containing-hemolysin-like protein
MLLGLLVLWTLITLLAGTSSLAIQGASRTRLAAALKRLGREAAMENFDLHRRDYALTALIARQMGIVLFVITLGMILPATSPWWRQPAENFAISAAWLLVFGAAVPTSWARYAGEAHVANVLRMLNGLRRIMAPILFLVKGLDEVVRRLAGAPADEPEQTVQLERELLDVVTHADVERPVDESKKAMIKSVMSIDERSAGQVMTPRTDMVGIRMDVGFEGCLELIVSAGHSRIPVYEDTPDHVVGVLFAKDLLTVKDPASFSLKEMMRPIPFVPETKDLASLLREFQANRVHMAIVLDEYGGTAGLITIEDILEELVGDIADEHDEPARPPIRRVGERIAEVDARVRIEELNSAMGLSLPEDEAYDTIAGYVFSKLGRIPAGGEMVRADGMHVTVLSATDRSIARLRVEILDPAVSGMTS